MGVANLIYSAGKGFSEHGKSTLLEINDLIFLHDHTNHACSVKCY